MKITRYGHGHQVVGGDYHVDLDKPTTPWWWDDLEQCLKMRQNDLPDFSPSSSSRHDYILSVSLDEVRAMFDALCVGLKKKKAGRAE